MDKKTILRLNQLNTAFYAKVARSFSKTRQQKWIGWSKLPQYIRPIAAEQIPLNILDIGCGNGRFFTFINQSLLKIESYTGIDSSEALLNEAKALLQNTEVNQSFLKIDVIQKLLEDKFLDSLQKKKYSLVSCFGVFHHIPTQELRKKLIENLEESIAEKGVLIISFWQFAKAERFLHKTIDPTAVGIEKNALEEGDYLLGWDKETLVTRYCHSFSETEILELVDTNKWKILAQFQADGKENNLNAYLVLQRNTQ